MITSFFNKSKSINFIVVFLVALLAFVIAKTRVINNTIDFVYIIKQSFILLIVYASIFLLNFIVNKNSLTQKNNYEMLLFTFFLLCIPESTGSSNVIISNIFVLLGLRRLISLQSQKNIKKKLFDASTWIAIAALFYFWSILFFLLIIIALILYVDYNVKHWVIPFVGLFTIFIISVSLSIIFYDTYFAFFDTSFQISYDFSSYNSIKYLIAITLLLSFGSWSSIFYLKNIKRKKKATRASFKIIIIASIIAFLIVIHVSPKNGSEFLFLFMPLAIIITNYVEVIQDKWFKEIFLGVLILVPFVLLLL